MISPSEILKLNFLKSLLKYKVLLFDYDDNKTTSVDVVKFYLEEQKSLSPDVIIEPNDALIGIEFSPVNNMLNVCKYYHNMDVYFWLNLDEIKNYKLNSENWNFSDIKRRHKSIKETWTTTENKNNNLIKTIYEST